MPPLADRVRGRPRPLFDYVVTFRYHVTTEVVCTQEHKVGVRELKSRLSHYLGKVSQGDAFIVTDRGKPVAELRPVSSCAKDRLRDLALSGKVRWSGNSLTVKEPLASVSAGKSVADLVLRDRE